METERKANILLVDDKPDNLVALEAILNSPDYNLVKANSGREALKYLLKEDFAVILLDVQMPEMDGFETAALIREREKSRHTPIIFITAISKDETHVSRGYSLGAVDYIFKPVVPEILKAKVAGFVELFRKTEEVKRQAEQLAQSNKALEKLNAELASSRASLSAVLDSTVDAILTVDGQGVIQSINKRTVELFGYEEDELIGKELGILISGATSDNADAILTVDQHGVVQSVNKATSEMLGYEGEELLGMELGHIFSSSFRSLLEKDISNMSTREKRINLIREIRALKKSGEEFPCEIAISEVSVPPGSPRKFTVVIRDITERKRAEEALARYAQDLERSNAELEQFAYVASHDLQEPLRMVASYTELLAERYQDKLDEKAQKYIRYAVDGARRMQVLINDLLALSRVGTKGRPPEPTDCGEVLAGVLKSLEKTIEESGAEVVIGDLPTVMADPVQIGQVFQNLISNSIKFRSEAPPRIEVTARRKGAFWEICVADNGIGIDPEFHERIFTIFQRLHGREKYPGTGVGLAIVKKIVERHGGQVRVESAAGQGARFFFTLPAADSEGRKEND